MDGARERAVPRLGDAGDFMQGPAIEDPALCARIENFMLDYAHAIDDGDLHAWPRFFAEDGRYKIIIRENFEAGLPMGIMYCEGAGMMRDRVLALETANIYEPHTYSHILSRPRLRQGEGGQIHARSNFLVTRTMQEGRMETFAAGKYLDRITPQPDGGFLLTERLVVLDSRRIDILLVYPL